MFSALLLAAFHGAAVTPAQVYRGPLGRDARAGAYLVPLVRGTTTAAPAQVEMRPVKEDEVVRWNEAALRAVKAKRTSPPMAARNLAMIHAAVYDAVNAVYRTNRPYLVDAVPPPCTSAQAAAAVAAHRVLVKLYPDQAAAFNALLDESFRAIPDGPGKDDGVHLGQFVAEQVLAWRADDGSARQARYAPAAAPGVWQPTPPDFRPPLLPQWGSLRCFALGSGSRFRPEPPPALTSAAYAAAFREVRALGGRDGTARAPEQTEIARFWADGEGTVTPPGHWNRIAQVVGTQRGNGLAENARLFALLNMALADASIACWDCKYQFGYWRPIQAIREAGVGERADETADPRWTPLLTTPPFPSYTSGHSTFSAAGATVLAMAFGTDAVRFATGSDGLPGVTRTFDSFWHAAEEAGQSRIYGGIHWQFDNTAGLSCGRKVGEYVVRNFLVPCPCEPPCLPEAAPASCRRPTAGAVLAAYNRGGDRPAH